MISWHTRSLFAGLTVHRECFAADAELARPPLPPAPAPAPEPETKEAGGAVGRLRSVAKRAQLGAKLGGAMVCALPPWEPNIAEANQVDFGLGGCVELMCLTLSCG